MDKKTVRFVLIGIGIGIILLVVYQTYMGAFSSPQVYNDGVAMEKADGNAGQTALNYNALGFKIISGNDDICISPNVLAGVIGLYTEGAVDQGRDCGEMMLGSNDNFADDYGALTKALTKPKVYSTFSSLFMDKKVKPKKDFTDQALFFGVYFETVDYFDFVKVKELINSRSKERTDGLIPTGMDNIDAKTYMIFTAHAVVKENFSEDVGAVAVSEKEFMGSKQEFYNIEKAKAKVYENDNVLFMALPMNNGYKYEVVMAKNNDLPTTLSEIKAYRDKAESKVVRVSMPATKYKSYNRLKEPLKKAGFDEPFNKNNLISNITNTVKTKVDKIDQSIEFEIMPNDNPKDQKEKAVTEITVDKPFYYMVADGKTGCDIIMGKKTK